MKREARWRDHFEHRPIGYYGVRGSHDNRRATADTGRKLGHVQSDGQLRQQRVRVEVDLDSAHRAGKPSYAETIPTLIARVCSCDFRKSVFSCTELVSPDTFFNGDVFSDNRR